jgi:DNA transformation protein
MPARDGFLAYVLEDVLSGVPDITSRAMFGGYGIYQRGNIFAIIADGKLFFKADASNRGDYEARGSEPFTYQGPRGKPHQMSYYEVPEEIMEDREEIRTWVSKAASASARAKEPKRTPRAHGNH